MRTSSIANTQAVGARTQEKRRECLPPTGRVALEGAELIVYQRRLTWYDDTPQAGREELTTPVSSDRCALPKDGPVVSSRPTSRTGPRRSRDGMRGKYLRVTCEAHASPVSPAGNPAYKAETEVTGNGCMGVGGDHSTRDGKDNITFPEGRVPTLALLLEQGRADMSPMEGNPCQ